MLDGSHCLCLPSDGSPSQGDPKNQAMAFVIAPGWPGMPWFLQTLCSSQQRSQFNFQCQQLFADFVQLSTEIPIQLPVSTTLLKQSHNYVFNSNPQHLNLHAWCLGVDSSKNKASLWRWQRELLPLKVINKDHLQVTAGPI